MYSSSWKYGLGVLLLLLGMTWLVQQVSLWHVTRYPDFWRAHILERLESDLSRRFHRLDTDLEAQARAVARDATVQRLLQHPDSQHLAEATVRMQALHVGVHHGVEVYTLTPRLLLWRGAWLPLDDAVHDSRFLEEAHQSGLIQDGDIQWGIAHWVPVTVGDTLLGGVRAAVRFYQKVPFRNRYLQPFSREAQWNVGSYWPFELRPYRGPVRNGFALHARDGRPLVGVHPATLSAENLRLWMKRRWDDVLVLWLLVGSIWLMLGWVRLVYPRLPSSLGVLSVLLLLVAERFVLVLLDLPDRWFKHIPGLRMLADPALLASDAGFGILGSIGALWVTATGLAGIGLWVYFRRHVRTPVALPQGIRLLLWVPASAGLLVSGAWLVRALVVDSTLDFFSLEALIPDAELALVLGAALLLGGGLFLTGLALSCRILGPSRWHYLLSVGLLLMAGWILHLPWISLLLAASTWPLLGWLVSRSDTSPVPVSVTLRVLVPGILLISLFTYGLLAPAMHLRQQQRMLEELDTFREGRDVHVLFALDMLREELPEQEKLASALYLANADIVGAFRVDSLAEALFHQSLLADLTRYQVTVALLRRDGRPVGRFQTPVAGALQMPDTLQQMLADLPDSAVVRVLPVSIGGRVTHNRYVALIPVDGQGWVLVVVEPLAELVGEVPFPGVLSPEPSGESWLHRLSLGAFVDGRLWRAQGAELGIYRLPASLLQEIMASGELWRREVRDGRAYWSYYLVDPERPEIIYLARVPQMALFEWVFYLFRLSVLGLLLGFGVYLVGLYLRYQRGWLPAMQTRFQDRLLEAFLGVGLLALLVAGVLGTRHVEEERRGAVAAWHRRNLQQVEFYLLREAGPGESPVDVLERLPVRTIQEDLRLDVNIYRGYLLAQTTRPLWFQQRLLSPRLPLAAYDALYLRGQRQELMESRMGSFRYLTGYQVLLDGQGRPQLTIEVLTLPELERLREERARTLASFLSALFILFLITVVTGVVVARTLSRPLLRIREGLRRLARGEEAVELPVTSRDEVGALVQTFNEMQRELAESRRKLARQERELAWQEMARQVAHEIKNPLTPMKLSVQHLRRLYDELEESHGLPEGWRAFGQRFRQVTRMLVEQIDALTRIANAFSRYGSMPRGRPQPLNLHDVIEQVLLLWEHEYPHITFERAFTADEAIIFGDAGEIRQVYINLIKNALEAMPEGGTLRVSTRQEEGRIICTVEDTGTGIPEDILPRIFEPHFSTRTSGTGMGLAITRRIVEAMQGTLRVETREGEGTVFTITFPAHIPSVDQGSGENPVS